MAAKKKAITKEKVRESIIKNLKDMDIVDRFRFGSEIKQGRIPAVFLDIVLKDL